MTSESPNDLIQIGTFGIAHGVSGRIKVRCFTEAPESVAKLGPITTEDGSVYRLKQTGVWKDGIVVSIQGIRYRDQADALRGQGLYVPRAVLPKAEADEVYHVDLIGVEAEIVGRLETATIVAFHDFGAGDIMEVQPQWSKHTVMVPFNPAYVTDVDVAAKRVVIEDVPGLFEASQNPETHVSEEEIALEGGEGSENGEANEDLASDDIGQGA